MMSGSLFNAFMNDLVVLLIMYEFRVIVIELNMEALDFADDYEIFANDQGIKKKIFHTNWKLARNESRTKVPGLKNLSFSTLKSHLNLDYSF